MLFNVVGVVNCIELATADATLKVCPESSAAQRGRYLGYQHHPMASRWEGWQDVT
jgi:hypothetical protein